MAIMPQGPKTHGGRHGKIQGFVHAATAKYDAHKGDYHIPQQDKAADTTAGGGTPSMAPKNKFSFRKH
jgi:hypothetical protein